MQSVVGIAFLVIGVVLIIFGMQASASLGSRLSELFTGAPSDRTIWLLVAGVAAAILGLGLLLVGRRVVYLHSAAKYPASITASATRRPLLAAQD